MVFDERKQPWVQWFIFHKILSFLSIFFDATKGLSNRIVSTKMHCLLLFPLKPFSFDEGNWEIIYFLFFSLFGNWFLSPHHPKHRSDIIVLQTHSNLERNFYTNQTSVSIVCQTISYIIFFTFHSNILMFEKWYENKTFVCKKRTFILTW